MKIAPAWLKHINAQRVLDLLTQAGHEAFFVGGCVRDAVLGREASDIDIASSALPESTRDLAEAAGLRVVATGLSHGTVTVISDGQPFEVTTFRRDIETDGRHATVQFTDQLAEDAARRDFTMNALYADGAGTLVDPTGQGHEDALAGRVRFVGEPAQRITEDYLRILRFFRFHAHYGDANRDLDPEALHAIASHVDGLGQVSRERVGAEMRKLLDAPDPAATLTDMASVGALEQVLPQPDPSKIKPLIDLEMTLSVPPEWIRRLAALSPSQDASEALRLSKAEGRALREIQSAALGPDAPHALGYRLGQKAATDALLLRAALGREPWPASATEQIAQGAGAQFPIRPADLAEHFSGAALGETLRQREDAWIASGFRLTREELLR
ncbi:MAG: CCA tRNA nucleotidyltransferase [Pseudomonadota bacterium]